MTEPVLSVTAVSKRFPGTLALDNVSLSVFPGEIHALMGENGAGKSTLLKILSGSLRKNGGEIVVKGEEREFASPIEAQGAGISIVHQELSSFPEMSIVENIFSKQLLHKWGIVDRRSMIRRVKRYFDMFHLHFSPAELLRNLSVSEQQIVEIIKALMSDSNIYIFDEPTSSLSLEDAQILFSILEHLKSEGKGIIYVSHKFDEIFRLADRISVLRDGKLVGTGNVAELTPESVVSMMVGRTLEQAYPDRGSVNSEVLMKVSELNAGRKCKDVSFELHKGEILGVFGLVGAGRTEIMRALTGIDPRESGSVEVFGKRIQGKSVQDSIGQGLFYLTEDRKSQGLFLGMNIQENVAATHLPNLSRGGLFNKRMAREIASTAVQRLKVKATSVEQLVGSLSGGNQQKVMIGKWLTLDPKVVILDEPTRGIDVGAKSEIHHLLRDLTNQGIGVVVISSELPEILGLSDRVLVVYDGKIAGEVDRDDFQEERIMTLASGLDEGTGV